MNPAEFIQALSDERRQRTDHEILAELEALPPLLDEQDASWEDDAYWMRVAYPYLALADLSAQRRLPAAISLLLERACFGDPGEIMRGLRHALEAIANPDWALLADRCLHALESNRPGTVLWAVEQLLVLADERARPQLVALTRSEHERIASAATAALDRLARVPT